MAKADISPGRGLRGNTPRRLLQLAISAVLFLLMMITVIDVIGRDLFDAPLRGGYEMSGLILMALFFCGLPFATAARQHITVGLIDGLVPDRVRRGLDAIACLASAIALLIVSYYVLQKGLSSMRYQEATMFLRLPLGPFSVFAALSLAVTGLILLWQTVTSLRATPDGESAGDV